MIILTTSYNCENFIEKSLMTIMTQRFKDFTCYITDDLSTDNTVEILEKIKLANANFDFTSLGILKEKLPHRIERIAHCRNYYVEYF
jgi:glycosyltransferase involved in cell wall biosynthesis